MRAISSAIGLIVFFISVAGCTAASGVGDRQSSITTYGTVDAGVSVTTNR